MHYTSVSLTGYDVVCHVPLFGAGVHPGVLVSVGLLEEGICDRQLMLCTQKQQAQTIGLQLASAMVTNDVRPGSVV